MKKNKQLSWIAAILVCIVCFGFQCERDTIALQLKYAFKIPVDIYPLKKSYTLADTIWIETDVTNKLLYDSLSSRNINMDSASIYFSVQYVELAGTNTNPPDGLCQIISPGVTNIYRQLYKGYVRADISVLGCNLTTFKLKLGFKPNYRGNYLIALNYGGQIQYCIRNAGNTDSYSTYTLGFKPSDLNKDVFDALPDTTRRNETYPALQMNDYFSRRSAFMVKVN